METKPSHWEASQFRREMLARIGEGMRDYFGACAQPTPDNLAELLRRLDGDRADPLRPPPSGPPCPNCRQPTRLVRVMRVPGPNELHTFQCTACGVAATTVAKRRGSKRRG